MEDEGTDLDRELLELNNIYKHSVRLWCFNNNTSLRELCLIAGVKYHTVWNCFNKGTVPSQQIVYGLYKVTGIKFM